MKEKYMIVKIKNILAELRDSGDMITEKCYEIIELDYETPEIAHLKLRSFRCPQYYIIVKYYQ